MAAAGGGQWYILDGAEPAGPYTAAEVLTWPGLSAETQVCRAGEEQWQALHAVPELYQEPSPGAQPVPAAVPASPATVAVADEPSWLAVLTAKATGTSRPLLFVALMLLLWGGAILVHTLFQAGGDPRLEQAQSLILRGKGVEAEGICRALLQETPAHAGAQFLLAESLFAQRRNREALTAYQAAQRLAPNDQRIEAKIIIIEGMGGNR
ncbi:MAG TPA: GYF domain-containing protein [bacterium]|nr:GYF domain-containing protein [bacterium]